MSKITTSLASFQLEALNFPDQITPKDIKSTSIQLHNVIAASGKHNFLGDQINVKSQLIHICGMLTCKIIPLLIRFGFPVDFDRTSVLKSLEDNHSSARLFPKDIEAYLDEEIKHGAILGPFAAPPLNNLHISPMMTREKPNASHHRVIIDLSFPQGLSVNTGVTKDIYLDTPFILKLPTIDTITNQVKALGRVVSCIKLT